MNITLIVSSAHRLYQLTLLLLAVAVPSFSQSDKPTVLLFIIDGLQSDAARVAIANGATNMKFLFENGVSVQEAYCSSPSAIAFLPDKSRPWGTASPPNVAMHTGTHVFESKEMDDVFRAGQRVGIKSVFSGSAENYKVLTSPNYTYAVNHQDSLVVDFALDHFRKDGARLLSIHVQELRSHWTGPEDKLNPGSGYQNALRTVDRHLGRIIETLKRHGVWDSTYVIVSSDHGMGMTGRSDHPASSLSSWTIYMNFYGPGIKRGKVIPYAETPDIALLIARLLSLPPLKGHTNPGVSVEPRGTTGTFLSNLFEGDTSEVDHPKLIRRYLESKKWKPADDYAEYRAAMLSLVKGLVRK